MCLDVPEGASFFVEEVMKNCFCEGCIKSFFIFFVKKGKKCINKMRNTVDFFVYLY